MTGKQRIKQWRQILSRQESTGQTLPDFCRRENLNYKTALKYRHIIDAMSSSVLPAADRPLEFIEIPIGQTATDPSEVGIKLELGNGVRLELPSGFDPQKFLQIAQLLCGGRPC